MSNTKIDWGTWFGGCCSTSHTSYYHNFKLTNEIQYHHALLLYTEGKSAKEAVKEAKHYSNSEKAGGKNAKNIGFDAVWGSITICYAEQAAGLPESKLEAIENVLSELVGMDAGSDNEGFNDDDDIMDIHGVVLLSNLDTENGDPQLEQAGS
ncbi:hypothetical protein DFH29DRAFT_1008800 [Suillus ampliporus]|nr:hypothetical protein DFH29DRAFT_1008800 [Suillus ampliporus]